MGTVRAAWASPCDVAGHQRSAPARAVAWPASRACRPPCSAGSAPAGPCRAPQSRCRRAAAPSRRPPRSGASRPEEQAVGQIATRRPVSAWKSQACAAWGRPRPGRAQQRPVASPAGPVPSADARAAGPPAPLPCTHRHAVEGAVWPHAPLPRLLQHHVPCGKQRLSGWGRLPVPCASRCCQWLAPWWVWGWMALRAAPPHPVTEAGPPNQRSAPPAMHPPVGLSTTSREALVKPSLVTGSMYSWGPPSGTGVNLTAIRSCAGCTDVGTAQQAGPCHRLCQPAPRPRLNRAFQHPTPPSA